MRAKRRPARPPATCIWTRREIRLRALRWRDRWRREFRGSPRPSITWPGGSANCRLKESLRPAIRLAREGFPLYPRLQAAIRYKREVSAALARCGQGVSDRRGRGAGARHPDQAARSGAHSRGHGSPRRQGLLRRSRGAGFGERRAGRRRHLDAGGSRHLSGDRAQAAGRELSRRTHRVRLAALIGRRCLVGCAQYFGGLRSEAGRFRDPQTSDRRSDAPRLSRPRGVSGGSGFRLHAARPAHRSGLRRRAALQHSPRQGDAERSAAGHRDGAGGAAHHAFLDSRCRRQSRGGHALGQSVLRHGRDRSENRRAAQQHHGRFLHQAGHAECVRPGGQRRERHRAEQASAVQHDAEFRRNAEGPDDHRHARRQLHHQHGASGNARLPGRHERRRRSSRIPATTISTCRT